MISINAARINDVLSDKARTSIVDPPFDAMAQLFLFDNTSARTNEDTP
jgi:hypothetical protein